MIKIISTLIVCNFLVSDFLVGQDYLDIYQTAFPNQDVKVWDPEIVSINEKIYNLHEKEDVERTPDTTFFIGDVKYNFDLVDTNVSNLVNNEIVIKGGLNGSTYTRKYKHNDQGQLVYVSSFYPSDKMLNIFDFQFNQLNQVLISKTKTCETCPSTVDFIAEYNEENDFKYFKFLIDATIGTVTYIGEKSGNVITYVRKLSNSDFTNTINILYSQYPSKIIIKKEGDIIRYENYTISNEESLLAEVKIRSIEGRLLETKKFSNKQLLFHKLYHYHPDGKLSSIKDKIQLTDAIFEYDAKGNLLSEPDQYGQSVNKYENDDSENWLKKTNFYENSPQQITIRNIIYAK